MAPTKSRGMPSSPYLSHAISIRTRSRTALHFAAARGHAEACQLLVDRGANVQAQDSEGCTALHRVPFVCFCLIYVDVLFKLSCDVPFSFPSHRLTCTKHATQAVQIGSLETVQQLANTSNMSMLNMQDADGNTALHVAIKNGVD